MNEKINTFMFEGKEIGLGITWNMLWMCIGSFIGSKVLTILLF